MDPTHRLPATRRSRSVRGQAVNSVNQDIVTMIRPDSRISRPDPRQELLQEILRDAEAVPRR